MRRNHHENPFSLPDVEREAALYADFVRQNKIRTLRFWPLKKSDSAHSNRTRRHVLARLVGLNPADHDTETLERTARFQGYRIETVDPTAWQ